MSARALLPLLAVLVASLAFVPGAFAQGSGPLLTPPTPEVDTAPPPDDDLDDDGLGIAGLFLFGGGLLLLGGITYVIMRDARRSAPADSRPHLRSDEQEAVPGGAPRAKQRKRDRDRRRAKGKRAKQQRKRNR